MFRRHGVRVFSSNYALYGDMSARVMAVLAEFAPRMEVYSIDEAFLDLTGLADAEALCRDLRRAVARWTGIPVSVGLAPTKTLAKAANAAAKRRPELGGVLDLPDGPARDALLRGLAVDDVWGIGPRRGRMLRGHGITTALALRDAPDLFVRSRMGVTGWATVLELRGRPCLALEQAAPDKKAIVSSRSFGRPVESLEHLLEAVSCHAERACAKLRGQGGAACQVSAFVRTNAFRDEPQHHELRTVHLAEATAHSGDVIRAAQALARAMFRPGCRYKKAGIMLSGIEGRAGRRAGLLGLARGDAPADAARRAALMDCLDRVNADLGRETLRFASSGLDRPWDMRRAMKSPAYTTRWDELPVAR